MLFVHHLAIDLFLFLFVYTSSYGLTRLDIFLHTHTTTLLIHSVYYS